MLGCAMVEQGEVVRKLVVYSALMWLIPAVLYYSSAHFQHISDNPQLFGYLSVFAVNLVVVAYIVQAFREKPINALKAD